MSSKLMKDQPLPWGKILSAIALIAGTTVGAGVLALPSVTFHTGVIPSTILLIGVWAYTFASGLLIAELTVKSYDTQQTSGMGLLGLTQQYLGNLWEQIATGAFLFLHYALLVAYVSEGSNTLTLIGKDLFQVSHVVPHGLETLGFVILMGGLVALGSKEFVARINTLLVGGVMVAFAGLLWAIATQIDVSQGRFVDWTAASPAIPVMLVAMFYHNVIPVVTRRLAGNSQAIRLSLFWGSLIPLVMFLIWNGVVLCSVGAETFALGLDPLDILREQISSVAIQAWIRIFSLLAVATSFIGVSYGLINVFQDLWPDGNENTPQLSLNALVFLPPMGLCSFNPDLFIAALSYAGTFSVATLYGLLPAVLVWRSRYSNEDKTSPDPTLYQPWTPGGRCFLVGMVGVASILMLMG